MEIGSSSTGAVRGSLPSGAPTTAADRPQPAGCAVVAPFVLEQVALNGGDDAREAALTTLMNDTTLRAARIALTPDLMGTSTWAEAVPGDLPSRLISDAHNTQRLPGDPVRGESDPESGDVSVNEAFDGLGITSELLSGAFGRDSIDGAGMELLGSVHFDKKYDNAFWDGVQMVFGDGDGVYFNRFTVSLDVIGHELMHGVTEREAGLVYLAQPGALNESLSDVVGSLVKQWSLQQKAEDADWLIGAGLFTDAVQGVALRSLAAPGTAYNDPVLGKDPQPAHMDDYVFTTADNGGVHINSGIPNHAFYQLATSLGGYAWEDAGLIWYTALTSPGIGSQTDFPAFARLTHRSARRIYGPGSDQAQAVREAWSAVGIRVGSSQFGVHRLGPVTLSGEGGQGRQDPWAARAARRPAKKAAAAPARRAAASPAKKAAASPSRRRSRKGTSSGS
jgi:Thermolysin metallopeptidase, alpha-helical domain/Thermolysin metallopeptidase, catalytic domain